MFQSKRRKALQFTINGIKNDLANNYKDNAIERLERLKKDTYEAIKEGKLKPKEVDEMTLMISQFEMDIKNFKRTY